MRVEALSPDWVTRWRNQPTHGQDALVAVEGNGGGPEPKQRRAWPFSWMLGGFFAWLAIAILVKEFLDPPFDPVRVLVRLALAGLMAWFFAWLFTVFRRTKD